jgi:hypothetical protein
MPAKACSPRRNFLLFSRGIAKELLSAIAAPSPEQALSPSPFSKAVDWRRFGEFFNPL